MRSVAKSTKLREQTSTVKLTIEYKISIKFIYTWEFTLFRPSTVRFAFAFHFIEGADSMFNFYVSCSSIALYTLEAFELLCFDFYFFFFCLILPIFLTLTSLISFLCTGQFLPSKLHNILHINWVSDFTLLLPLLLLSMLRGRKMKILLRTNSEQRIIVSISDRERKAFPTIFMLNNVQSIDEHFSCVLMWLS